MKRFFIITLILLVVSWSAGNRMQKSDSNAIVEVIDGVEYIHNTETPIYPEKTVTFVEDLSIGGEGEDGNNILFMPLRFDIDDNGNICISEQQDQVIKVFSSDGKYVKTIGAKGSGPGEFQTMTSLAFTKDGKLVVTDRTTKRTSLFDSSGKFLRSFKWHKDYFNFILIKNSSYILGERAYSGTIRFGFFYVKEIDFDGNEIRSFDEFKMPESLIIRREGGTHYTGLPVAPRSIFTGDKVKDLFYHCLNNKYIIEVYDSSGRLFRKINRPYKPVPFTKKDADEYRARYDYSGGSKAIKKAVRDMKMPKVKNVVSRMHVDDESNLWIRTNEVKEEEDKTLTAYDIFDSDGFYYAKIWTPVLPSLFKDGKMYRMHIDQDTGYRSIKRYKVSWNY